MQELVNIVQAFRMQEQQALQTLKIDSQSYSKKEKSSPVVSVPEGQLAINISDKDWTDFLSAPSLLGPTTAVPAVTLPNDLFFNFGLGG